MMKTVMRTALTIAAACVALLAITAATPVPDGLATPAAVAADASVPEAEATSHPCSAGVMGTCYEMEDATCVLWPPPGVEAEPYVKDDACDLSDDECVPE